jgi:hypothetical protein
MIAKCECQNCGQGVEFEAADFQRSGETSHRLLGQTINCPSCGQATQIYMPRFQPGEKRNIAAIEKKIRLEPCPDCGKAISPRALMCPDCGRAVGIRFGIIWEILGHVMLATAIMAIIGLLFEAGCQAIRSSSN